MFPAGCRIGRCAWAERVPYANSKIEPPTPAWTAKIQSLAPTRATVDAAKRKVLVFSLFTGFKHNVAPYVDRVFEVLGKKSGAFDATQTVDIEALTPKRLAAYDVLVLNNNCSIAPRRNLFLDELEAQSQIPRHDGKPTTGASGLFAAIATRFCRRWKGTGCNSRRCNDVEQLRQVYRDDRRRPSTIILPNQELTLSTVDADHPLVAAFRGKGPFVHRDEPYCFKGSYEKLNFHPLLSMQVKGVSDPQGRLGKIARYVAWIKPYGKGRVFYCSPSHFPESYETATLLQFLLDGVQYASGDLKCDDSKLKQ